MNCGNVSCKKLSKTWFLLHLNRPKLTNYLCHFVMEEDPVVPQKTMIIDISLLKAQNGLQISG